MALDTPSLTDRAERLDRLLLDLCRRAEVGMMEAPVPWNDVAYEYSGRVWEVKRSLVEEVVDATDAV